MCSAALAASIRALQKFGSKGRVQDSASFVTIDDSRGSARRTTTNSSTKVATSDIMTATMRLATVLVASVATAASVAPMYELDAGWPAPQAQFNMSQVTAVAVLGSEVHVAQRGAGCPPVVVFAASGGRALRSWGGADLTSIHGLTAHPASGSLFATDILDGTVKEFTGATGALVRTAGHSGQHGPGLSPLQFSAPADVAVTAPPDNFVVVADGDGGSNNRVLALTAADLFVIWGAGGPGDNGSAPGAFSSPHAVAYDARADALLVADRGNKRIQLLAAKTGLWLGEWQAGACFTSPWGVRVDSNNSIMFVADGDHGVLTIASYVGVAESASTDGSAGARRAPPILACTLLQNITIGIPEKPHELAFDDATRDFYLAGVGVPPTIQRYVLKSA